MITGLTAAAAHLLVQKHRCACGGSLVDCWGGSFGINAQVVRCLNDIQHNSLKLKDYLVREILNGRTGQWEAYNMVTQKPIPAETGTDLVQYQTDHGELALSTRMIKQYLCPQATTEEAYLFLCLCRAQRLNPMIKEAYLVVFTGKNAERRVSMIVARDVFIRRAEAHPMYAGFEAGITVEFDSGNVEEIQGALVPLGATLLGGWSKVYRKDRNTPHYTTISNTEYNTGMSTWSKMPGTMNRKVAIVQGFREAFPTISVGMGPNVVVADPGDIVEGEGRLIEELPPQTAPVPGQGPASSEPAAEMCPVHEGVRMRELKSGRMGHRDGAIFCYGRPAPDARAPAADICPACQTPTGDLAGTNMHTELRDTAQRALDQARGATV